MSRPALGPRLIAAPGGTLRAALVVPPTPAIEALAPLPGEPGAIFGRALEQHQILVKTLQYFGVEVAVVEPAGDAPAAVAVADLAVVFESGACMMRPSNLARFPEVERLEAFFADLDVPILGHLAPPGFLDGSDVLLAGRTAFVGISRRSNETGRAGFGAIARSNGYDVVEVALAPEARSLRAVANVVAAGTVAISPNRVAAEAFDSFSTIEVDLGEEFSAGVLPLGERRVLAEMRFRTSLLAMQRRGIAVEAIDLYEFTKVGIVPSNLVLALKRSG
ncbi:MAG: hypothetical protein JOZ38_00060 [Candidatus Eremiobacteraeota bacterium]|nr:hypothetical protein [Candidatus Eremiobacteraeota bacterium]